MALTNIGQGGSAWSLPDRMWWEKSLQENVQEIATFSQIALLPIPEALAFKSAEVIAPTIAAESTATAVAGAGAGLGSAAAFTTASIVPAALKTGFDVTLLAWLTKYWWVAALLLGIPLLKKIK